MISTITHNQPNTRDQLATYMHLILLLLQLRLQLALNFLPLHRKFAIQSFFLLLLLQFLLVQQLLFLVELCLQVADFIVAILQFLVQLINGALVHHDFVLVRLCALALLTEGRLQRCVLCAKRDDFALQIV